MSQRSSGHNYRADSGRVLRSDAPKARAEGARRAGPAGPTTRIAHAGHQFRLGPITLLDRGRQPGDHGRLVACDRNLFRLPRRRAVAADRAAEGAAVRLRGPHRRASRPGRPHHQPAIAEPGAVRAEARADHAPASDAGIARFDACRRARSGRRPARSRAARRRWPSRRPATSEGLPDQRHGDLHRAARPRSAAGVARTAGGGAAHRRARPNRRRSASRARWRGCRPRSIASRRGRPRRSTRSKSASIPRPSAFAACWPISAWMERRHRPACRPQPSADRSCR